MQWSLWKACEAFYAKHSFSHLFFFIFVLVWFVINMRNNKQTVLSKASVSVRRAGGRMRRDATSSPLIWSRGTTRWRIVSVKRVIWWASRTFTSGWDAHQHSNDEKQISYPSNIKHALPDVGPDADRHLHLLDRTERRGVRGKLGMEWWDCFLSVPVVSQKFTLYSWFADVCSSTSHRWIESLELLQERLVQFSTLMIPQIYL